MLEKICKNCKFYDYIEQKKTKKDRDYENKKLCHKPGSEHFCYYTKENDSCNEFLEKI